MKIAGIQFPETLLAALRDHKLVVFAGTGVSMGEPANLPDYRHLAESIANGTREIMQKRELEDRFLGRLQHKGVSVHIRAAQLLSKEGLEPTNLHTNLLRLYSDITQVRIVTTNFDLLFEKAANSQFGREPEVFRAPALPLGRDFTGIVHLHGSVKDPDKMILTDADFGRAYLTEGWARRFLVDLFQHNTVLFVGYSHNDTIISYLARALPKNEEYHRFALIDRQSKSTQHWQLLGIESIVYSKPIKDDYRALYKGVQCLADMISRSILDWKKEVTRLAEKPPSLSKEEADIISYVLKDASTARFFTDVARGLEWIKWLDTRKIFEPLFTDCDLDDRDKILAHWLAEHYAIRYSDTLFLLIANHEMHLNPKFWCELGREIANRQNKALNDLILSRWVSLLLETLPADVNQYVLSGIVEYCIKQKAITSLLQIFNVMARYRLKIQQPILWAEDTKSDFDTKIYVEFPLLGEHFLLNDLWEKGLKPYLANIAEPLLKTIVQRLEEQYIILKLWSRTNRNWDHICFHRSAIEPHEQDQYPDAIDVLIDSARDSLEWLASNQIKTAAQWCEELVNHDMPILRRLSVYTLSVRKDMTADEKIDWLLTHIGIHDIQAYHEICQVIKLIYPNTNSEHRTKLLRAIKAYRYPDMDNPNKLMLTAHQHFDWLYWLHSIDPDCFQAKKALDNILIKYPEFKPKEHPDLLHYSSISWHSFKSPYTAEQLLEKPAAEWLTELLIFQPKRFDEFERNSLLGEVIKAAKLKITWGFELATALNNAIEWGTDLWTALIRAWSEIELNEEIYRKVIYWLGNTKLYLEHTRVIANTLHVLLENNAEQPYVSDLLPQTNSIALTLWHSLDRAKTSEKIDDYLEEAINNPAGILSQYWLDSLSLWRRGQDTIPKILSEEYYEIFSEIVKDQTLPSSLGKAILASQFAFLLEVDEVWTQKNLLPLFNPNKNTSDAQAVWDGFLTLGYLNLTIAKLLENSFIKTMKKINKVFHRQRDRFIEYYTLMIGFYAIDPHITWIPELINCGSIDDRRNFTLNIKHHLRDMKKGEQKQEWWQRWLKSYWENRVQGIPDELKREEIEGMLGWLPYLGDKFPEAVDIAIQMPRIPLQQCPIIYYLNESELTKIHPEAVVKLLLYLGDLKSHQCIWDDNGSKLINRLLELNLPSELKYKLRELIAKLGFK